MTLPLIINSAKSILVTGGAGFIGSHTVDHLLQLGHRVIVLDNLFSGKKEYLDLSHPNLEWIEGDVLEYPLLLDLLKSSHAVLHLAAIASVQLSITNPFYSFQVNTQGLLHLLEAIRHTNRAIRLVYASSAAVYGDQASACDDELPLSGTALSPYALQKLHMEHYAELYAHLHGIKSLALRYFNVYGSRQDASSPYSGVISRFLQAARLKTAMTIFGDGQQSRDFISVSDVVKANVLALSCDYHGVLNIATGVPKTLLQLIQDIEAASHRKAILQFEPARSGDIKTSYGTMSKAEKYLQFRYSQSLKEGISELLGSPERFGYD